MKTHDISMIRTKNSQGKLLKGRSLIYNKIKFKKKKNLIVYCTLKDGTLKTILHQVSK